MFLYLEMRNNIPVQEYIMKLESRGSKSGIMILVFYGIIKYIALIASICIFLFLSLKIFKNWTRNPYDD